MLSAPLVVHSVPLRPCTGQMLALINLLISSQSIEHHLDLEEYIQPS